MNLLGDVSAKVRTKKYYQTYWCWRCIDLRQQKDEKVAMEHLIASKEKMLLPILIGLICIFLENISRNG